MPPPTPPPPPDEGGQSADKPWWKRWYTIVGAVVVVLVVIAGIVGGGDDEIGDEGTDAVPAVTGPDTAEETPATEPPTPETTAEEGGAAGTTEPSDQDGVTTTESTPSTEAPVQTEPPAQGNVVAGAPEGVTGNRNDPVPAGEIADIGDGYRLQVLSVVEDGTQAVLAENQFNEPPPEGARFSLVEVALGYYGFDDPQAGFFTTIQAVGAGSTELSSDCGVIPNELRQYVDVFAGGVLRGNLCFLTTPEDSEQFQLYASTGFAGDDVFLDASASPAGATAMATLTGIQPGSSSEEARSQPTPVATPAEVGEGWTLAVTGAASDITDAVLGENQFNEPPPEGFRFVGVPVRLQYGGDGSSNAFTVTTKAVGDSNVEYGTECGVVPGELDSFTDVFAGGIVEGSVCFVVPAADLGSEVLYAGTPFEDPVFFAVR